MGTGGDEEAAAVVGPPHVAIQLVAPSSSQRERHRPDRTLPPDDAAAPSARVETQGPTTQLAAGESRRAETSVAFVSACPPPQQAPSSSAAEAHGRDGEPAAARGEGDQPHAEGGKLRCRTAAASKNDLEAGAAEGICRICLFQSREADDEARGIVVSDTDDKDVLVPLRCGCKVSEA